MVYEIRVIVMSKIHLTPVLVISAFLLILSSYAYSQESNTKKPEKRFYWDSRPDYCFKNEKDLTVKLLSLKNSEKCRSPKHWVDYYETKKRLGRLFMSKNIDHIQQAEESIGFSTERFSTGEYLFQAWFDTLEYTFKGSRGTRVKLTNDWIKAQGAQGYSIMAQALTEYGDATLKFNYRRFRNNSPGTLVNFSKGLMKANATLDRASSKVKQTALWYEMKLKIAYQHPKLKKTREKLFNEAIEAWPEYPPIYEVAYTFSRPKWGGSYEAMDAVALLAVEKTKERLGAAMYPLVIPIAMLFDRSYGAFRERVDWDLMKQGFRDYQQYLGGQPEKISGYFASAACRMGDLSEARRLYNIYDQLKKKPINDSDRCRKLAFSKQQNKNRQLEYF